MFKLKKYAVYISMLLIFALVITGCGSAKTTSDNKDSDKKAEEKFKVGFIYIGSPGDAGWTYAHDLGKQYMVDKLPNVEPIVIQNVQEGAPSEKALNDLVQKGCKVIFATSFGYMDSVQKVAKANPDVVFLHCSGYKRDSDNVGTYFGRMYEPRYLSGIVAGKMTKTNKIGYVAAFDIPEVVRMLNAFTLGVRSVNSKATVKVVWTGTWYDPPKERAAADTLLDQGVDIIAQHQDTTMPMVAAEERGKYGIGYNSDMRKFAPKAVLTGPIWNWGPYYEKTVKAVMDGTWTKKEDYWGHMSDGIVDLGPFGPMVPQDVQDLVNAKKQEIYDGKLDIFTGPLKDNTGKEKVAAGQKMTDAELLSFDWLIEGVEGKMTK